MVTYKDTVDLCVRYIEDRVKESIEEKMDAIFYKLLGVDLSPYGDVKGISDEFRKTILGFIAPEVLDDFKKKLAYAISKKMRSKSYIDSLAEMISRDVYSDMVDEVEEKVRGDLIEYVTENILPDMRNKLMEAVKDRFGDWYDTGSRER